MPKPQPKPKALHGTKYPKPSKAKPSRKFSVQSTMKKEFKNQTAWLVVIAFCLGNIAEAIASDPTDFLFFLRESSGKPMAPIEQVFYWYFLTALFHMVIIFIAILGWRTRWFNPTIVLYILIGLGIIGAGLSWVINEDLSFRIGIIISATITILLETLVLLKVKSDMKRGGKY